MKVRILKIGNSKYTLLVKRVLNKYGLLNKEKLTFDKALITLQTAHISRKGWDEAFKEMHANNDDRLLIDDIFDHDWID